jgi:hypothetical protein
MTAIRLTAPVDKFSGRQLAYFTYTEGVSGHGLNLELGRSVMLQPFDLLVRCVEQFFILNKKMLFFVTIIDNGFCSWLSLGCQKESL